MQYYIVDFFIGIFLQGTSMTQMIDMVSNANYYYCVANLLRYMPAKYCRDAEI